MGEFHSLDLNQDEDGWYWPACACGWQSGPFPGPEEAIDDYGDHRADAAPPGGGE